MTEEVNESIIPLNAEVIKIVYTHKKSLATNLLFNYDI